MGNLIFEAKKTEGKIVGPGANVIFNTASPYSSRISYDPTNGEITFLEAGQYLVLWWIAPEISQKGPIQFALKTLDGDLLSGNSSSKRAQTTGFGVIDVGSEGTTLSLVNMTTYQVILCPRLQETSRIVTVKMPEEGVIPRFGVGSVDTLPPGEDATVSVEEDAQNPNNWLFSFGIPEGKKGDAGLTPEIGPNGNWFIGGTDTGIPAQGPAGKDGITPAFKVEKVDTLKPGEDATADIQKDTQDPNLWLFSFGIPRGEMGGVKAYRANLNATNRTLMVPIKDLTLEIVYVDTSNLDAYLTPSRKMTVDIRRLGLYTSSISGTDQQFNDYEISNRTRIDDNFLNRSNEKWYAWIRQQDQDGFWSLHEVSVFSSKGGARTTVWVTLIEDHVDYDNPNNPVD